MKIVFVTILFSLALGGCLSVPVTNIPKLLALKPETMDVSGMELAVRVQDDFVFDEGGAKMSFDAPKSASDEVLKKSITLIAVEDPLPSYLQKQTKKGFQIKRFRVNTEDLEPFEVYRSEVLAERELGVGRKKSGFFAFATGCLASGANPFQDLKMTLYLKTDEDKKFFKLIREQKFPITTDKGDKSKISFCDEKLDQPL